jgi:hypothetical protein
MEKLTDERAVLLLDLLCDYAEDAIARGDTIQVPVLRVSELAGDLIDSLPHRLVMGARQARCFVLEPDCFRQLAG